MRPTSLRSSSLVSSPTQNSRNTAPSSANTSTVSPTSTEQGGPHEDSGQDLADDGRLVDPLEELVADLRGQQDQEEVEDRLGDARRRRGEDH
ncbi:MAG TPA: hypothetical protein VI540_07925 [Gaiellaceae bacterium]|nr:hypothetical protein [Gaiellaceae bacterium]